MFDSVLNVRLVMCSEVMIWVAEKHLETTGVVIDAI